MESSEQIERVSEFLETKKAEIAENIRKKNKSLLVNFQEIAEHDPELSEELLENPEDIFKAAEMAVKEMNFNVKEFHLRVRDIPENSKEKISNIRTEDLGKLIAIDGIVRQKSDVRPQVTLARFECPACGNVLSVPQLDSKYNAPNKCSCGRKGKFKELSKEMVDAQGIVLEEDPENLEGGQQPKRINLFLKHDLVSPIGEMKTTPGSPITITGVLKEVPIINQRGGQSTKFDLVIEVNSVTKKQETFSELNISEEDEEKILELSRDQNLIKKLTASLAPSIYGYELVKQALLLQLFSGITKKRSDGVVTRGDMHILLIGDPGSGKSQLLKRTDIVAPKSRYVSGKGASGAGLTASVVKDEFIQGWSLEAGALVLASRGLCCIDEMDKMSTEDRSAMHEALEQQTVTVSKANIQATLSCKTTVLAAANPKFGRFDPYTPIINQIDLPPPLISRFDLIFPVRDIPEREDDNRKADHILSLHQEPDSSEREIDTELLRKYIAYSKKYEPVLTNGAKDEIKRYYIEVRNKAQSEESGSKTVPITTRHLEAIVRMAESFARMKLLKKVRRNEAKLAIELLHSCLSQVGVDPETGNIDTDIISTGISSSQRGKIMTVKEVINDLEQKVGKTIPLEDIIKEGEGRDIDRSTCEDAIEKLRRSGDIFEPKPGFIQKI